MLNNCPHLKHIRAKTLLNAGDESISDHNIEQEEDFKPMFMKIHEIEENEQTSLNNPENMTNNTNEYYDQSPDN